MKNIKKYFILSLIVLISLSLFGCKSEDLTPSDQSKVNLSSPFKINLEKAVIVKHVDGDTTKVKFTNDAVNGEYKGKEIYVRFIGVNTPETVKANSPVEPYGKEASNFTHSMLKEGKTIYLEKDAGDKDKYGRLLRYVWLSVPKDNSTNEIKAKMLNAILLDRGYAQVMTVQPNVKYIDLFLQLQKTARNGNKGLWAIEPYKSQKQK